MTKDEIRDLISQARMKEAINAIQAAAQRSGRMDLEGKAAVLANRFHELKSREMMGTIDSRDAGTERNQITSSLLSLLQDLPEKKNSFEPETQTSDTIERQGNDKPPPLPPSQPDKDHSPPHRPNYLLAGLSVLIAIGLIIGMVAYQDRLGSAAPFVQMLFILMMGILAGVVFFDILKSTGNIDGKLLGIPVKLSGPAVAAVLVAFGAFKFLEARATPKEPFTLTVRLRTDDLPNYPKPASEAILKLWLHDDWKEEPIGPEQVAYFRGLPASFMGKKTEIDWEGPYWKLEHDSIEINSVSQVIRLVPDGSLGTLRGRVFRPDGNGREYLEGVILRLGEQVDTSGTDGQFTLAIPLEEQKVEQQLHYRLPGQPERSQMVYPGRDAIDLEAQR